MKIAIIMPVRNCLEYTQAAISTIATRYPFQTYVIDDRSDAPTKEWLRTRQDIITFTDPPTSGVAASWNLGISSALADGCTHVLVANNDILLHPVAIDTMAARINRGGCVLVSADDKSARVLRPLGILDYVVDDLREIERPDFACFMITEQTIQRIGWFDENYRGAYYEDNDYEAQIVMSGHKALSLHAAPYFHYGCRTIDSHKDLAPQITAMASENLKYFISKWGRRPTNDLREMRRTYAGTS